MTTRSMTSAKAIFASEAELCSVFIKQLPAGWTAYPESCGFDIVLVRHSDGAQIGVEAKLRLNPEVILQAVESYPANHFEGPDFRAVLVPYGAAGGGLCAIARKLGITVIIMKSKAAYLAAKTSFYRPEKFEPELPRDDGYDWKPSWFDCCPLNRLKLPEYVPDVTAGASAPVRLSEWKIKAIKIWILLDRRGFVTRADFKELRIDHRLWLQNGWLKPGDIRGKYLPGDFRRDLRRAHPVNYAQIEADFDKWAPKFSVPDHLTEGELL